MRKLNKQQKDLLDQWLRDNSHLPGLAMADAVELLDSDLWEALQEINDFEVLYQHVDRYVNDNAMKYNDKANPHFNNHLGL